MNNAVGVVLGWRRYNFWLVKKASNLKEAWYTHYSTWSIVDRYACEDMNELIQKITLLHRLY